MFQGEWFGIPLVTPLKPHGPGLIVFLDGWGFAQEDKVLYLTIIKCRYLNAMDFDGNSDPYCVINCNGHSLQTSVKWNNLNPDYYESFEIDVTNPSGELNIVVMDRDYFGSDDFMGQIVLKLNEFENGVEIEKTYLLRGEDPNIIEEEDRGEITLRVRWAERKFEDDQAIDSMKMLKATRLQSWIRRLQALFKLRKLRLDRTKSLTLIKLKAIKITNTCRIRIARKELKRRQRLNRSAIKIQKRVRIWIAKKIFEYKIIRRDAAIIIQTRMRVCLAKSYVIRMKTKAESDISAIVTTIQKNVRRWLICINIKRKKDMKKAEIKQKRLELAEEGIIYEEEKPEPVSNWILTYGVDQEYILKRNRRITERLFQKILRTRYIRILTKYGITYVDSYPPKKTEEEILIEMQEGIKDSLTNRKDFVAVYLPSFLPSTLHRKKAIEQCLKFSHFVYLHIPSSVYMRKTVDYNITTIQCLQRQRIARKQRDKMIRFHKAIIMFQRLFRSRYEIFNKASIIISSLFRMIKAKNSTKILKIEKNAACIMQRAYRCYVSRCKLFDLRCITELSVLKYSPSFLSSHGPEKALEHRDDTFWIAESTEKAEIRIEFMKIETISSIWIMTSTYSASPNNVSIHSVPSKQRSYIELVDHHDLPLLKQHRWHKLQFKLTVSKYFKLIFYGNYGDDNYISVKQIRFLRSGEQSATIVKQPLHYILDKGPSIGDSALITLRCIAEGWPTPTYQWYKNEELITGETSADLKLRLQCPPIGQRAYRCLKCKMVSNQVPTNAYHIQCGNCSKLSSSKDVSYSFYLFYTCIHHHTYMRIMYGNHDYIYMIYRWMNMIE
jgi:hypothetical protein